MNYNEITLRVVIVLYLVSLVPYFYKMCKHYKEDPNTLAFTLAIFVVLLWPLIFLVVVPWAYLRDRFKSKEQKRLEELNRALDEIIRKGREDMEL